MLLETTNHLNSKGTSAQQGQNPPLDPLHESEEKKKINDINRTIEELQQIAEPLIAMIPALQEECRQFQQEKKKLAEEIDLLKREKERHERKYDIRVRADVGFFKEYNEKMQELEKILANLRSGFESLKKSAL